MNGAIGTWLVALAGPVIKRMLVSIGIGVISYAAITAALTSALSAAKNAWSGLSGSSLALIQMAGINTAMSILAGALIARVALMSLKKLDLLK